MTEVQKCRENLILGIIENYHYSEFARFLITLRQTAFVGHVCLFAGPGISPRTIRRIRRQKVEVIRYGPRFPFIADPHAGGPKALPEPIHIFNYRHFLYHDFLLKHGGRFRNVLLTDVKDVVFQRDPFVGDLDGRLHVAMETKRIPIGRCAWTSEWVRAGYGPEVLEQLNEEELSCAGTVFGPGVLVREYLRLMLKQIQRMHDAFNCADQAAHNLMLHNGQLNPVMRHYNFNGPVATVGTEKEVLRNNRGELVNRDGSVIALIHQYDRHPNLIELFHRKAFPSLFAKIVAATDWALAKALRMARRRAAPMVRKFGALRHWNAKP